MKNGILLSTRITEISITFTQSFNWLIVCIIDTLFIFYYDPDKILDTIPDAFYV